MQTTQLRAIHASSDAPNVDVYVNGSKVASDVAYQSQTAFLTISSGATPIQINPAGSTSSVINVTPTLMASQQYTAIAVGDASATAPAAQALTAVLVDDPGNSPAAGNVKVRVVHGAPAAPAVDVYVTAPGASLSGSPTISALAYQSYAPAAGQQALEVPGGNYEIRVTAAGSTNVLFDSGQVALPANADLLITAVPSSGVAPIALLAAPATGQPFLISDARAAVRVAHFAPDVPAVNVFLGAPGTANSSADQVENDFSFSNSSGYLDVSAGTYDASVSLYPGTASALDLNGAALNANTSTSVFAIGLLNGTGPQALKLAAYVDDRTPVSGKAKVRVIHLSPDAPAVDVVALSGNAIAATLVSNLSYPNATAQDLVVDPNTYTLAVVPHGASSPLLPSSSGVTLSLKAGDVVTVAAVGCVSPGVAPCTAGQGFALVSLRDN